MRRLRYTVETGVGDQATETDGRVVELLESIPYLLTNGLIPPRNVLNEVLKIGSRDAGMSGGCRWEPFELTTEEFRELVDELEARSPDEGEYRFVQPPEWVRSYEDWSLWCAEYLSSIPAELNRKLHAELRDIEEAMEAARQSGEHNLADELSSKLQRVAEAYSDFVIRTRRPSHGQE